MAEIIDGRPLVPCRTQNEGLWMIHANLGGLPDWQLRTIRSENRFTEIKDKLGSKTRHVLADRYKNKITPDALDFLIALLVTEPAKRLTAAAALQHRFLAPAKEDADSSDELLVPAKAKKVKKEKKKRRRQEQEDEYEDDYEQYDEEEVPTHQPTPSNAQFVDHAQPVPAVVKQKQTAPRPVQPAQQQEAPRRSSFNMAVSTNSPLKYGHSKVSPTAPSARPATPPSPPQHMQKHHHHHAPPSHTSSSGMPKKKKRDRRMVPLSSGNSAPSQASSGLPPVPGAMRQQPGSGVPSLPSIGGRANGKPAAVPSSPMNTSPHPHQAHARGPAYPPPAQPLAVQGSKNSPPARATPQGVSAGNYSKFRNMPALNSGVLKPMGNTPTAGPPLQIPQRKVIPGGLPKMQMPTRKPLPALNNQ
eukprot:NODE_1064_length_1487_cov_48.814706_g1053_i0.p1 GENE.NODE_1064_length_1487_cov_48.814706_g1053_i0~~NODE_1064_length_1487_cov_48.814706_g1053_i0.p1  ORF type:complete len:468 (-),score=75.45 NODE_1064_length_1487_cov_48.814706_g1053_i0:82-1329(-)